MATTNPRADGQATGGQPAGGQAAGDVARAAVLIAQAVAAAGPDAVVAFTGSGISAESGVPVFRGNEGLWEGFRAEELATPQAFAADPERVWRWYHWRRRLVVAAQPNPAHRALARLEREKRLGAVVTQNVDGLHQRAGSQRVVELHGSLHRARCIRCGWKGELPDAAEGVIRCARCGEAARPDVVWFGEVLPEEAWNEAYAAVMRCRVLLVIGTSGVVYPAAALCEMAAGRGADLIVVNPEHTELENLAAVSARAKAGEFLPALADAVLSSP